MFAKEMGEVAVRQIRFVGVFGGLDNSGERNTDVCVNGTNAAPVR